MKLSQWTDYFYRAAKEEIGIAVTLSEHPVDGFIQDHINTSRPPGFEDYTVCLPSTPNTIFIVKPGVTLD